MQTVNYLAKTTETQNNAWRKSNKIDVASYPTTHPKRELINISKTSKELLPACFGPLMNLNINPLRSFFDKRHLGRGLCEQKISILLVWRFREACLRPEVGGK